MSFRDDYTELFNEDSPEFKFFDDSDKMIKEIFDKVEREVSTFIENDGDSISELSEDMINYSERYGNFINELSEDIINYSEKYDFVLQESVRIALLDISEKHENLNDEYSDDEYSDDEVFYDTYFLTYFLSELKEILSEVTKKIMGNQSISEELKNIAIKNIIYILNYNLNSESFYDLLNYVQTDISAMIKDLGRLYRENEETLKKRKKNLEKKFKKAEKTIEKSLKNNVAILGIFASIVISFSSAMFFAKINTPIITSYSDINIHKYILIMSGMGVVFLSMIYFMVKGIYALVKPSSSVNLDKTMLISLFAIFILLYLNTLIWVVGVDYFKSIMSNGIIFWFLVPVVVPVVLLLLYNMGIKKFRKYQSDKKDQNIK